MPRGDAVVAGASGREAGRTRVRVAFWLAWSLVGLSLLLFVASIVLYILTRPAQTSYVWGTTGVSALLVLVVPLLAFPLVGALIAFRRPENPIGWICLSVGLVWMVNNVAGSYATYALRVASPGSLPRPQAVGSLAEWLGPETIGLLATYLLLLFPDGRLLSRRWRSLAYLCGVVLVLNILGNALAPGPLTDLRDVSNPFGLEDHPLIADARVAVGLLVPLCVLASAAGVVLRFRRSNAETREQIKWLAFAAVVVAFAVFAAVVGGTFFTPNDAAGAVPWLGPPVLEDAITLSFAGIPLAIGFAVLKYRLYDIGLLVNRTLVYGFLSVLLAAIYFGGVVGLQYVFRLMTGQGSTFAVIVSTLCIAALFGPLRHRVQEIVDRRFYRRKYDAARTLEAFAAGLREQTDLEALKDRVVNVAIETVQPAHVSLWLRSDAESRRRRSARGQPGNEE